MNRLEEWAREGLETASSDAGALLSTATDEPMCRYCGCWEGDACLMPDGSGCSWFKLTDGIAVYSAPACVRRYLADAGAP